MQEPLTSFLERHIPGATQQATWGVSTMQVTGYLSQELPPLELTNSVRSVVVRGAEPCPASEVLIIYEQNGLHVLPGGRREAQETVQETVAREVLEETGWTLTDMRLLGFLHFHHLTPKPEGHPYVYPDFFNVIFTARAEEFRKESMFSPEVLANEFVLASEFVSADKAAELPLDGCNQQFLTAALQAWAPSIHQK